MLQRVFLRSAHVSPAGTPICRRAGVIAIGALSGFLVGLTSVGSGSLILALLVLVAPFSAETLGGTGRFVPSLPGSRGSGVGRQLLIGSVPGVLVAAG
jgi:hypothetical protein